ncbi:MAG: hypothetical protein K2O24_00795 [Muribaculaceae bacterium]|nr:hypothetical protein [Muribaculaceae bacterium]
MQEFYYKDDFHLVTDIKLDDYSGIHWPSIGKLELQFFTTDPDKFYPARFESDASGPGNVYSNLSVNSKDHNRVTVYFHDHGLQPGRLKVRLRAVTGHQGEEIPGHEVTAHVLTQVRDCGVMLRSGLESTLDRLGSPVSMEPAYGAPCIAFVADDDSEVRLPILPGQEAFVPQPGYYYGEDAVALWGEWDIDTQEDAEPVSGIPDENDGGDE